MNAAFTYDQDSAVQANSGGDYLTESSVVRCRIESAKWTQGAMGSQSAFLELNVVTENGQQANFLRICHKKRDGSNNDIGVQQIHALMGVTGAKNLSQQQQGNDTVCPELVGRPVMLALERENYRKNDGTAGFRFQIKCFMSPQSSKTVAEHVNGEAAKSAEYWADRFSQNPTGNPVPDSEPVSAAPVGGEPSQTFDDDIPF